MRFRHALVLVVAILVSIASWQAARGAAARRDPQDALQSAPEFSVTRFSDGRAVSLADVRGKVVLLYFFFPT